MADLTEVDDLEPLFDYRRVQPHNLVFLDDDDTPPIPCPKRTKVGKKVGVDIKELEVVDCEEEEEEEEEEDWLPPPPKVMVQKQLVEDSAIKELRLKKQELVSFAKSADDVIRAVEESVKRKLDSSMPAALEAESEKVSKPAVERAKIVVSIQDKGGLKQFRVYADDKFERLFEMYADKVNLDQENLVFCFDGDKIGPEATPASLEMEDNDIIEVHTKKT
ncbi:uncharacterized protein LOC18052350 isoform X2 [Citrus clementina]|uniref:uncharacterized protein LOC18052350 isoform X2 n=1 Tax=Citrus clementina TaxID=85681 RepID=UPI000CED2F70|nr:uncharacterized protein LOC18052350 isoform X2 [Citrus x clementina]